MLNLSLTADSAEDVFKGPLVLLAVRELDTVIGKDGMNFVRDGLDEVS